MSANDAHNNKHKANLLKRRSRRSASINDLQEPTSPSSPVAAYPPLLIPEDELPAGSAPEFYGFVAWLATAILWFIYLLWALLPDKAIRAVGITWYPSREWALLIPSYAVFLALLTYFTYFALAIYATPSYSELKTLTDRHSHPRVDMFQTGLSTTSHFAEEPVPQAHDLPIGFVNQVLYGKRSRQHA
ncbi:phosphatidylinositol N-acetylglucosaminyltransferase subunit P [Ceratobasidium sp. AG-Ba]|nr:phosphatidylinositol N-acetylglucosaminyltransferase subunit P [Ceratobasidium sp. AG-Ba]QRW05308.1 phosphatidylinositol N-acetylglucosaminyltransferase subunit P [Ceratobasidium sp. AG-Ba]